MEDSDKWESGAGEQSPPKIKAEDNPWYLLAMLYGEPRGDYELKEKNRIVWNRYFAGNLDEETRARLIGEKWCSAEELTPLSRMETYEVEKTFAQRWNSSATALKLPWPEEEIVFANVQFDLGVDFRKYLFARKALFSDAIFFGFNFFSDAIFSSGAFFDGATFSNTANFDGATFLEEFNFKRVTCPYALFGYVKFSKVAHFESVTFSEWIAFSRARFSSKAWFHLATFSGTTSFEGATFSDEASFEGVTFPTETFSQPASFEGVNFSKGVRFDGARFCKAIFRFAIFSGAASFDGVTISDVASFHGTEFQMVSSFVNTEMKAVTSFVGAIFKEEPPRFFGTKLHQGTVWRGITWPPMPRDKHEAGRFIDAYACLKLEMDRLKKHEDELNFFALELQSRRVMQGPVRGLPLAIYEVLSDYGRSYLRPLGALFVVVAIGAGAFWYFNARTYGEAFGLSAANTLNVFGFRKDFIDPSLIACLPTWLKVFSAVQTILGTILLFLFLFGLGIRNKFRMK